MADQQTGCMSAAGTDQQTTKRTAEDELEGNSKKPKTTTTTTATSHQDASTQTMLELPLNIKDAQTAALASCSTATPGGNNIVQQQQLEQQLGSADPDNVSRACQELACMASTSASIDAISQHERLVAALLKCLGHSSANVAEAAAGVLAKLPQTTILACLSSEQAQGSAASLLAGLSHDNAAVVEQSARAIRWLSKACWVADDWEKCLIIQQPEAIAAIVARLQRSNEQTVAYAAVTLQNLACNVDRVGMFLEAGPVAGLMPLLVHGNSGVAEAALEALGNLANGPSGCQVVLQHEGAVGAIVACLQHSSPDVVKAACWAVGNLAVYNAGQEACATANAAAAVVQLFGRGVYEGTVFALANLACHSGSAMVIVGERAVKHLVPLWSPANSQIAKDALRCMMNISCHPEGCVALLQEVPARLDSLMAGLAAALTPATADAAADAASIVYNLLAGNAGVVAAMAPVLYSLIAGLVHCMGHSASAQPAKCALRSLALHNDAVFEQLLSVVGRSERERQQLGSIRDATRAQQESARNLQHVIISAAKHLPFER